MKKNFGNIAKQIMPQGSVAPFAFAQVGIAKWYNNGPINKSGDIIV